MARGTGRDSGRRAHWRTIINSHERSGLTVREFCRRREIPESAFYFWRRRLRDQGDRHTTGTAGEAAEFVAVNLLDEDSAPVAGRIEIELPGGRRVVLTPPVDRQSLADVVAVLVAMPAGLDAAAGDRPLDSGARGKEAGRC